MRIERITALNNELFLAIQHLVPQLTANHPPPSRTEVELLISSPGTVLLVAYHPDESSMIVGMASLIIYRVPTGVHARLEDVIVEHPARSLGVGAALTQAALHLARQAGADGVALTSHPRREAANHLYQKLGFKRWETNLYFYKF